jgi:hypothetical protein
MTGSFGRTEASTHSDLDLFILGKSDSGARGGGKASNLLSRLDEICIKADLIKVTRQLKIPEFSRDGQYLERYSVSQLTETLGTQQDDVTNTFTARLLLLLESKPLLGKAVYRNATAEVINAYWRDFEDHQDRFMPAFLANDILRLWRTFCVNYEARTERVPAIEKAKGKLKNYKLKHSRLLTCYSAILYLLAVHGRWKTVRPADALDMIEMTPTQRLEWLRDQPFLATARTTVVRLLEQYERFLATTSAKEEELIQRFSGKKASAAYMEAAYTFGDSIFEALTSIGAGGRFHRLLVV